MYYFTVAAIFKQEGHILREWIEHYLLHGAEHFYLINDHSTDNYMEVLEPYIQKGLVTLYNYELNSDDDRQGRAYNHYLAKHKEETTWIAILDLDEFLYSPNEVDLRIVLKKYEEHASIRVHWLHFGSNGHKEQPGDVVASFTKRAGYNKQFSRYISFKPIVRPALISRYAIHEHRMHGTQFIMPENENADLLINHYIIQSLEFWTKIKATRGDVNRYYDSMNWERDLELFHKLDSNDIEDTRLLEQNLKSPDI